VIPCGYDSGSRVFNVAWPITIYSRRWGVDMTEKLAALLKRALGVKMTVAQKEEQRRSFAYGNTKIENDRITRKMVNEQAETLKRRVPG